MLTPGELDPIESLRTLLATGRFQDVLDRHAAAGPGWSDDPAIAIAVATAATRLRRFPEGERLAAAALTKFRSRADDDGRLRALNLLGAIRYESGQLEEAAAYWMSALELARALADTTMIARASNNLGITHYLAGRVAEARSAYAEAMLAYQRLGDRRGLAETLHNLAIIARGEGALDQAVDFGVEAVRHAETIGDPGLLALMVIGRARTYLDQGDLEMTEAQARRAARLFEEAGVEVGRAEVNWVLSERFTKLGDSTAALDAAFRGREIAERSGYRLLQGECAVVVSRALIALDRRAEAVEYQNEARRIFTALGAVLWLERLPPP